MATFLTQSTLHLSQYKPKNNRLGNFDASLEENMNEDREEYSKEQLEKYLTKDDIQKDLTRQRDSNVEKQNGGMKENVTVKNMKHPGIKEEKKKEEKKEKRKKEEEKDYGEFVYRKTEPILKEPSDAISINRVHEKVVIKDCLDIDADDDPSLTKQNDTKKKTKFLDIEKKKQKLDVEKKKMGRSSSHEGCTRACKFQGIRHSFSHSFKSIHHFEQCGEEEEDEEVKAEEECENSLWENDKTSLITMRTYDNCPKNSHKKWRKILSKKKENTILAGGEFFVSKNLFEDEKEDDGNNNLDENHDDVGDFIAQISSFIDSTAKNELLTKQDIQNIFLSDGKNTFINEQNIVRSNKKNSNINNNNNVTFFTSSDMSYIELLGISKVNPPSNTTTISTPPSNTTTISTPPSNTTTISTPPSNTTTISTPPSNTTTISTPPSNTTTISTPPSNTTTISTPPSNTTTISTPPSNTTTISTPPSNTTTISTPPSNTTTISTPPSNTTTISTPPSNTTTISTSPSNTTTISTPPSNTTTISTPPSNTTTNTSPTLSTKILFDGYQDTSATKTKATTNDASNSKISLTNTNIPAITNILPFNSNKTTHLNITSHSNIIVSSIITTAITYTSVAAPKSKPATNGNKNLNQGIIKVFDGIIHKRNYELEKINDGDVDGCGKNKKKSEQSGEGMVDFLIIASQFSPNEADDDDGLSEKICDSQKINELKIDKINKQNKKQNKLNMNKNINNSDKTKDRQFFTCEESCAMVFSDETVESGKCYKPKEFNIKSEKSEEEFKDNGIEIRKKLDARKSEKNGKVPGCKKRKKMLKVCFDRMVDEMEKEEEKESDNDGFLRHYNSLQNYAQTNKSKLTLEQYIKHKKRDFFESSELPDIPFVNDAPIHPPLLPIHPPKTPLCPLLDTIHPLSHLAEPLSLSPFVPPPPPPQISPLLLSITTPTPSSHILTHDFPKNFIPSPSPQIASQSSLLSPRLSRFVHASPHSTPPLEILSSCQLIFSSSQSISLSSQPFSSSLQPILSSSKPTSSSVQALVSSSPSKRILQKQPPVSSFHCGESFDSILCDQQVLRIQHENQFYQQFRSNEERKKNEKIKQLRKILQQKQLQQQNKQTLQNTISQQADTPFKGTFGHNTNNQPTKTTNQHHFPNLPRRPLTSSTSSPPSSPSSSILYSPDDEDESKAKNEKKFDFNFM